MKDLVLSLRRLACCMSPESIPEPADRAAPPSSALIRARSQSPNETVHAHTQDAHPPATSFTHSSTMDAAIEEATAGSSPCTSTSSDWSLPAPEQNKKPTPTPDAVLCSLERLPVEIQTRILADSSLDSLRAIVKSSPRFYYVYSQNRLPILRRALSSALDGFFPDAYAACISDRYFKAATQAATWSHFRHKYLKTPNTVPSALAIAGESLEMIERMACFHLRVVEPLTERYCRWALGALSSSSQAAPLTKTEKSRIQRAMYRLQVICNRRVSDPQTMLNYLDSFGPWATEQIICVHEFAKERFSSAFIECAWELNEEENPKYSHVPILDVNEALLLYQYEDLNVGTLCDVLSLGLPALQQTFQAEDLEELCSVIRKNVESCRGSVHSYEWIDEAVRQDHQFERRAQFFSEHDELQDTQQKMLFEQDDLLSPPLAWVTFWDGRYSNQFGAHIPDALHRWGYVMWDAKRVKESGAMEYIELEWQCKYGIRGSPEDNDPRDYYITAYRNHQQQVGNHG